MSVESYSHVQHLVSSLHARLRGDLDRLDAFGSCFPAGTVTGAPKVRAMEIISELEPDTRGIYAGAMLYADYSQNLDSCIAIRTIVMREGKASVQAGAGIVADSVPESEYEETINKAKAMFRAIEIAEKETERDSIQT
jgi:anthranilate synthase component 1